MDFLFRLMGVNLGHQIYFLGKLRMDPFWVILKVFWSKHWMVRLLRDQTGFWLGGQKNDVSKSIIQVLGH